MKIIYPQGEGLPIAVVTPAEGFSVQELGRAVVPAGVPFRIVEDSALPADKTFREAWEADFSCPDGYGIGQKAWFIEQYEAELAALEAMPLPEAEEDQASWNIFKAQRRAELEALILVQQEG